MMMESARSFQLVRFVFLCGYKVVLDIDPDQLRQLTFQTKEGSFKPKESKLDHLIRNVSEYRALRNSGYLNDFYIFSVSVSIFYS